MLAGSLIVQVRLSWSLHDVFSEPPITTSSFAALKKVQEFYTTLIHIACSVINVIIISSLFYVFGQCLQIVLSFFLIL